MGLGGLNQEKRIREEVAKVEDFARQARSMAVSYQQAFTVTLKEGEVSLSPQVVPEENSYDEDEDEEAGSMVSLAKQEWPRIEKIDSDYLLRVRRWGENDFSNIVDRKKMVWLFEPNGMSEPIAVRLQTEDEQIYLSRVFHPLTALAVDEELYIKDE